MGSLFFLFLGVPAQGPLSSEATLQGAVASSALSFARFLTKGCRLNRSRTPEDKGTKQKSFRTFASKQKQSEHYFAWRYPRQTCRNFSTSRTKCTGFRIGHKRSQDPVIGKFCRQDDHPEHLSQHRHVNLRDIGQEIQRKRRGAPKCVGDLRLARPALCP